jgi:hypothetical protein
MTFWLFNIFENKLSLSEKILKLVVYKVFCHYGHYVSSVKNLFWNTNLNIGWNKSERIFCSLKKVFNALKILYNRQGDQIKPSFKLNRRMAKLKSCQLLLCCYFDNYVKNTLYCCIMPGIFGNDLKYPKGVLLCALKTF